MKPIEVIPNRFWQHDTGRKASIYGSAPWTSEAERSRWTMIEKGWVTYNDNGTVGNGRPAYDTKEHAEEYMRLAAVYDFDGLRAFHARIGR